MDCFRVGYRVVRGPDWPSSSSQDGSEGSVGTVVDIPGQFERFQSNYADASPLSAWEPDRAVVQWDAADKPIGTYRCGGGEKYELRILDTSPTGVCHEGVLCSECGQNPITGLRWRCRDCADTNLCSRCYADGKHEIDHRFCVIYNPQSKSVVVARRHGSSQIKTRGLFPGATVTAGPNWDYEQHQHPGDSAMGVVKAVSHGDPGFNPACVTVEWSDGGTRTTHSFNSRMLGLKCVRAAEGGFVYSDHLPVLGRTANISEDDEEGAAFPPSSLVHVPEMEKEIFAVLQMHVMCLHLDMEETFYKIGEVKSVSRNGDAIKVYFLGNGREYTVHQAALSKLEFFAAGDEVQLISDSPAISGMMRRNGGMTQEIRQLLGATGKVVRYRDDHFVVVEFGERQLTLHPACVAKPSGAAVVPPTASSGGHATTSTTTSNTTSNSTSTTTSNSSSTSISNSISNSSSSTGSGSCQPASSHSTVADIPMNNSISLPANCPPSQMPTLPDDCNRAEIIALAIREGNLTCLHSLLDQYGDHVNDPIVNGSCNLIHIALMERRTDMVEMLVKSGCDINFPDHRRNTPIHVACTYQGSDMVSCLLRLGARTDQPGIYGAHPMHVLAENGNVAGIKLLLSYGAEVNTQREKGNSPLHDAIRTDMAEAVEVLVDAGASMEQLSENQFTAHQQAAFHGSVGCMGVLVSKAPRMVDEPRTIMQDFTCTHVAALNNYAQTLAVILETAECDINARSSTGSTPLLNAVSMGARSCVEELIAQGADVTIEDNMGNTALHIAIAKLFESEKETLNQQLHPPHRDPPLLCPEISQIQQEMTYERESSSRLAAIACFLVREGSDISYMNHQGVAPLNGCPDSTSLGLLLKYGQRSGQSSFHGSRSAKRSLPSLVPSSAGSGSGHEGSSDLQAYPTHSDPGPVCREGFPASSGRVSQTRCTDSSLAAWMTEATPSGTFPSDSATAAAATAEEEEEEEDEESESESSCVGDNCFNHAVVIFLPCGHMMACERCCLLLKVCSLCDEIVRRRVRNGVLIGQGRKHAPSGMELSCFEKLKKRTAKPVIRLAANFSNPIGGPPAKSHVSRPSRKVPDFRRARTPVPNEDRGTDKTETAGAKSAPRKEEATAALGEQAPSGVTMTREQPETLKTAVEAKAAETLMTPAMMASPEPAWALQTTPMALHTAVPAEESTQTVQSLAAELAMPLPLPSQPGFTAVTSTLAVACKETADVRVPEEESSVPRPACVATLPAVCEPASSARSASPTCTYTTTPPAAVAVATPYDPGMVTVDAAHPLVAQCTAAAAAGEGVAAQTAQQSSHCYDIYDDDDDLYS